MIRLWFLPIWMLYRSRNWVYQISKRLVFIFSFNFLNLTIFTWNFQGCASVKFPRIFWEYISEYKPDLMGLFETRVSEIKADKNIVKLGFQYSYWVESMGFSGGI